MFYGDEGEEVEEDLEESDEEVVKGKPATKDAAALIQSLKQAKINSDKNASSKIKVESFEDDSDEEDFVEGDKGSSDDASVVP